MIRLMIGRDLKSLYIPPQAAPGETILELVDLKTSTYPGHAVSLSVRSGEILGLAGLVGSGRTELARVMFGIDAPVAGGLRLGGAPIAVALPARGHRARHLSGAGGPQEAEPAARRLPHRQHHPARPQFLRLDEAHQPGARGRQCRAAARAPPDQDAQRRRGGGDHVGRQPAEGRAGQMALHEAALHDLRRADPGHRCRRQERDLPADARPGRFRRRRAHDLQRHGGGDRGQRPDRRDA